MDICLRTIRIALTSTAGAWDVHLLVVDEPLDEALERPVSAYLSDDGFSTANRAVFPLFVVERQGVDRVVTGVLPG